MEQTTHAVAACCSIRVRRRRPTLRQLTRPQLALSLVRIPFPRFLARVSPVPGPSRKRGPPKGYIDAIEARLHQTEALVGILLAADDIRARSLLDDLAEVGLSSISLVSLSSLTNSSLRIH